MGLARRNSGNQRAEEVHPHCSDHLRRVYSFRAQVVNLKAAKALGLEVTGNPIAIAGDLIEYVLAIRPSWPRRVSTKLQVVPSR
jgi:hypothetical protein